jgi:hypothetical protein
MWVVEIGGMSVSPSGISPKRRTPGEAESPASILPLFEIDSTANRHDFIERQ